MFLSKLLKTATILISVISAFFLMNVFAPGTQKNIIIPPKIDARSAIVLDAWDGLVLYEKNPDEKLVPASTVKIMTAVVALESVPLDAVFKIPEIATRVEPTRAGFLKGDKYSLRDMLAALLIKSGNDAAIAIAVNIAESEKKFAKLMNDKALAIGMNNTHFVNASGLPDKSAEQYTTATDLSKLMLYALKYPEIIHLCSLKQATIQGAFGKPLALKTHNRLLLKNKFVPWGKTGYTRKARRTFVGVNPSHENKRIVFAFLKSDDIWRDITKLNAFGLANVYERHNDYMFRIKKWLIEYFRGEPLYIKF